MNFRLNSRFSILIVIFALLFTMNREAMAQVSVLDHGVKSDGLSLASKPSNKLVAQIFSRGGISVLDHGIKNNGFSLASKPSNKLVAQIFNKGGISVPEHGVKNDGLSLASKPSNKLVAQIFNRGGISVLDHGVKIDGLSLASKPNNKLVAQIFNRGGISVLYHGIKNDGVTLNSKAINNLVSQVSKAGGGTIVFPPGKYLTGTIELKSNVTLDLENGATILGSHNPRDYPISPNPLTKTNIEFARMALIRAEGQTNVAIEGDGTIDGQGKYPAWDKGTRQKAGMSSTDAYLLRPYGLSFVQCHGVRVKGIHLHNLVFWSEDYLDCSDVLVEGIQVHSRRNGQNNDGIDIDGSQNVRVIGCTFHSGDDGICLKSSYSMCKNIAITGCTIHSDDNAIKFGTASRAGFENIAITNCAIFNTYLAGIAIESADGGKIDNVTISNLAMDGVGTPIFIRLDQRGRRWIDKGPRRAAGSISHVSISNIVASVRKETGSGSYCSSITGLLHYPVQNVTLSNIQIVSHYDLNSNSKQLKYSAVPENENGYPEYTMFGHLPSFGFFVRHANNITFHNVTCTNVGGDSRFAYLFQDVSHLNLDAVNCSWQKDSLPAFEFVGSNSVWLHNCEFGRSTGQWVKTIGGSKDVVISDNLVKK